jgi:hypothetical protein
LEKEKSMRRTNVVVTSGILLLCLVIAFVPLSVSACETTKTTTLLSSALITLGDSVTDVATVTPGALGTVRFEVSTNGGATWNQYGTVKTLSGGSPNTVTSDPYTPTAPGTYYFRAVYTPSSTHWANSKSGRYEEPLMVKLNNTVPEVPTGTIMAVAAMVLALSCMVAVKRRKQA